MKLRARYALALAACSLVIAGAAAALFLTLRSTLSPSLEGAIDASLAQNAGALFFVFMLIVAALGIALNGLFNRYVAEPLRLAEEARLMLAANPSHRIGEATTREAAELREAINALAARIESLMHDVDARIETAKNDVEQEKTRLAALVSELTDSVVVCNIAARVLLYNDRAQRLLTPGGPGRGDAGGAFLGLGRSLFTIFDRDAVSHALQDLEHRLQAGERQPVSVFITRGPAGGMIRVRMAPVLAPGGGTSVRGMSGFIVVLDDVTLELETGASRDERLTGLVERARSGLASIRAAVENLMSEPAPDAAQRRRFLEIIASEAQSLGDHVARSGGEQRSSGPALAAMRGNDLTSALKRRIEARADVTVSARDDASVWVVVDRFLLVEALAAIASRLHTECGVRHIELTMGRRAGHAELDLAWRAAPLTPEVGRAWQRAPLGAPGVGGGASFEDVMQRHGGEALYNEDADAAYFRVLLPLADHGAAAMTWPDAPSRPTFYDFDLFNQPGQSAELDQRLLAELSYTVFDTETTGLAPSQGDEIVSIGAVRIVNGRLLEAETFDQLVNPRRALSTASIRVHGITGEMLQSAPTIERALPAFHRFCEDTVLVAHNAAFDLRFVQLKERACGVCFDQPVLDTLMLSAVVHPSQPDHTLEAIAARFGIGVVGRHTALGDALVTAEIFLKMIPLLEAQGIRTLGEAREAASRTAYARIGY